MSLLGAPVLVTLALLTVLLPTGAVLAWRRLPGSRWLRRLQQLGLVIAAQLSAVLLFLVAVNDYGSLFTSWSQAYEALTATTNVWTITAESAGDGTLLAFGAPTGFTPGARFGGGDPRSGQIVDMVVHGSTTGLSSAAQVYLPPAYAHGDRRLPVVLVFTGYPGGSLQLTHRLKYPQFLTADIAHRLARPMVLVMMRPSPLFPRDTECTNIPGGPQVLSFLGRDVPTSIAAQLHLQPTGLGAIGDSSGGYCALKLAMMLPRFFHAGVALSGYYKAPIDPTTGDLYGGSAKAQWENDLAWRIRHGHVPPVALLLATSPTETGTDGYATQQRLAGLAHAPLSVEEFVLRHGFGHSPATWVREIPTALSWLSWELGPHPAVAVPAASTSLPA